MEIERIREKLKEVIDPELGYDVVSLGEIEEIKIENKKVFVKVLPTTPLCPYLPLILEGIEKKIKELGYDVEFEIDFENKWDLNRLDPELRKKLGL